MQLFTHQSILIETNTVELTKIRVAVANMAWRSKDNPEVYAEWEKLEQDIIRCLNGMPWEV